MVTGVEGVAGSTLVYCSVTNRLFGTLVVSRKLPSGNFFGAPQGLEDFSATLVFFSVPKLVTFAYVFRLFCRPAPTVSVGQTLAFAWANVSPLILKFRLTQRNAAKEHCSVLRGAIADSDIPSVNGDNFKVG